ncbi:hypothetical protein SAMN06297129_2173 [Pseudooceanicola antarcticus]|uniref:Uncharacterized protein n=1 Tax=Pseudooceanicola antarcticus TaxID=1247613 RepID=A0A285IVL8_9RHOB|nr:hypothetical protein CVM39_20205 [Pseudooceanicola antarcticus]SNY52090.1 hypothetical protein SAMN06297129_2173 [Pseudooceanicola antarcticus]
MQIDDAIVLGPKAFLVALALWLSVPLFFLFRSKDYRQATLDYLSFRDPLGLNMIKKFPKIFAFQIVSFFCIGIIFVFFGE